MKNQLCAAYAFLLSALLPFHAIAEMSDAARLFGARESMESVSLSPLGDYVVYKTPASSRGTHFIAAHIATGKQNLVTTSSFERARVSDCEWAKNDRLTCLVEGEQRLAGTPIGFSRMFAVGRDGSNLRIIGTRSNERTLEINQFSGGIIDMLPDDKENVLMQVPILEEQSTGTRLIAPESGIGVKRFNIYKGTSAIEERAGENVSRYITDGDGRVRYRIVRVVDRNQNYTGKSNHWYRSRDDKKWKPISLSDEAYVYGFDDSGDSIYVTEPVDGRDALVKITLESGAKQTVFAHDRVDVAGLAQIGKRKRPVGVYYFDEYQHIEYFDPTLKALTKSLSKVLPGKTITLLNTSWDENRILLLANADDDPGKYYVFDRTSRELMLISGARDQLEGKTLAKSKPVNIPAADGTRIPGYLMLPPGMEGKRLPLVVMPHGGPSSRDTWGFDWLPQYLAAIGYAVLQPNYRGSWGYGDEWLGENGFQGWRQAIGDINDSARWAVASGIADPGRLAIVGWSYGGYAALQSNVVDPALYKAAVAIAPVTDFAQHVNDKRNFVTGRLVRNLVGSGPELNTASPAKNAAAIRAPVLMFHGSIDLNTNVNQSRSMARELRKEGKSVDYVEYDGLQHGLIDSDARIDMLTRIRAFLQDNLR
ncbi:S9 family peptidase [Sphingosinicella sp.]|uniref:S9 family peptidase n=1 Tax=Sphingosinicella sp. TaxID=1917971 RepID=UPI001793CC57|nr:S9 family peptidase [Sphingosinicella sp.]MBA4758594.1 S9 family peptidase [Sphingosinicella sp.]